MNTRSDQLATCECGQETFNVHKDPYEGELFNGIGFLWCVSCNHLHTSTAPKLRAVCVKCGEIHTSETLFAANDVAACECGGVKFRILESSSEPDGSKAPSVLPRQKAKRIPVPQRVKVELFEKCGGVCRGCLDTFAQIGNLEVDHIKPLHRGGTDDYSNLQLLCRSCNTRKGTGTMEDLIVSLKKAGMG